MAARLAMRRYDCRNRTPHLRVSRLQPLDRRMQQLGIGWEGEGLGLHGGVHRHPLQVARPQCAGLVRDP